MSSRKTQQRSLRGARTEPTRDEVADALRQIFGGLSDDELVATLEDFDAFEAELQRAGPRNPDELHAFIEERIGVDIPRTKVCEDHEAPFDVLCDLFFEETFEWPHPQLGTRVYGPQGTASALIMANRGGGKCVDADTLVVDQRTGRRVRIADAVDDPSFASVATLGDDMRIVAGSPAGKWSMGRKRCLRFALASGREIVVTPEHPFLGADGWARADSLSTGMAVATPMRLPEPSEPVPLPDQHVDLLAVLLAEGGYTSLSVSFSTTDPEIMAIVERALPDGTAVRQRAASCDFCIAKKSRRGPQRNPVRAMLDSYGIAHERATEKRVPNAIFSAPNDQIARFLSVFWMCDGTVPKGKAPQMTLASEGLLRDIQHLLLRLGIQSGVRRKDATFGGKKFPAWTLSVRDPDAFAERIALWGRKRELLDDICERRRNHNIGRPEITDALMAEVAARISTQGWRERRKRAPLVREAVGRGTNAPTDTALLRAGDTKTVSVDRLAALCDAGGIGRDGFEHLFSDDIWWDRIVNIEDAGERDVYDLSMWPSESFVANDIIVHNTFMLALLHYLNAEFKPGYQGFTFGANKYQGRRCYSHLKPWVTKMVEDPRTGEKKRVAREGIEGSLQSETVWLPVVDGKPGSKVEIAESGCLPGHVRVVTPEGRRRIAEIVRERSIGPVRSYDYARGEYVWCEVTEWHNNGKTADWLRFFLDTPARQGSSDLYCTAGHRLMTPSGEKKEASTFRPGDELCVLERTPSGEERMARRRIASVRASRVKQSRYDITVPPHANYVLASGVLVSNTEEAVNGPHPHVAHGDELEQMRQGTFDESRNMAKAGRDAYGNLIHPRNVGTSTRKSKHGRMQELIDEIADAERRGLIPPARLQTWCVFEIAAEVPDCRAAPEAEREARLRELGMDPCSLCNCDRMEKGVMDDGSERTMEKVCGGKLFRSRGYTPKIEIDELFRVNPSHVWYAQQECREPDIQNNYIKMWDPAKHCLQHYDPDPQLGPIFMSVDWGAGNPNAVNWYQLLAEPTAAMSFEFQDVVLPAGSLVVFDEIYQADVGAGKLAGMVIAREGRWRQLYRDFRVRARFADPQGRQQRADFKDHGLKTEWWKATRDVQTGIDLVIDLFEDRRFYVAASTELVPPGSRPEACEMFRAEIEVWRKNPKTGEQIDDFNHAMSAMRYCVVNIDKGFGQTGARSGRRRPQRGGADRARRRHGSRRGPLGFDGQSRSRVVTEFGERP